MSLLKLLALDNEDLEIVSAHLQDAVVKVADLDWRASEKRFIAVFNRYGWEELKKGGQFFRSPSGTRHRSVLHLNRVLKISTRGIDLKKTENVLSLLTIQFQPNQTGGGVIVMIFAGEAAIRLDVECIEAQLTDLGPTWEAKAQPKHI